MCANIYICIFEHVIVYIASVVCVYVCVQTPVCMCTFTLPFLSGRHELLGGIYGDTATFAVTVEGRIEGNCHFGDQTVEHAVELTSDRKWATGGAVTEGGICCGQRCPGLGLQVLRRVWNELRHRRDGLGAQRSSGSDPFELDCGRRRVPSFPFVLKPLRLAPATGRPLALSLSHPLRFPASCPVGIRNSP